MGGCRRACHFGLCGLAIPTKERFVQRNRLTFLPPFPKGSALEPFAAQAFRFPSGPGGARATRPSGPRSLGRSRTSRSDASRKRNTWRRVQRGRSVYFAENAKLVNQQALCSPSSKRLVLGRNILVFFGFYQRERYIIQILINFLAMFNPKTKSTLKVQKSLRLLTVSPVSMKYADRHPSPRVIVPFSKMNPLRFC